MTTQVKKIKGTPVTHQKLSLYEGWMPPFMLEIDKPTMQWHGDPIDTGVWNMIKAFFRWAYETHGSEAQARLYYNEQPEHVGPRWKAIVLPQYCRDQLATTEFEEHEGREVAFAEVSQTDGWQAAGTIHHHCELDAFQSGKDKKDEHNSNGIHITLGCIDKPEWNIDTRITYKKLSYALEAPEQLYAGDMVLKNPGRHMTFPKRWREAIEEPPPEKPSKWSTPHFSSMHGGMGYGYGKSPYYKPYGGSSPRVTPPPKTTTPSTVRSLFYDNYDYWEDDISLLDSRFKRYGWPTSEYGTGKAQTKLIEDRVFTAMVASQIQTLLAAVNLHHKPGKVTEALAPVLKFLDETTVKGNELLPDDEDAYSYYNDLLKLRAGWEVQAKKSPQVKNAKNKKQAIQNFVGSCELQFSLQDSDEDEDEY